LVVDGDRAVLAAMFGLMLGGIILSLAASPPVAARLNLDAFHFVNRHILFLVPTVVVLLTTCSCRRGRSAASRSWCLISLPWSRRRCSSAPRSRARRWLVIFGISVQPSEFLKPAFVILIAWLFANRPSGRRCRPTLRRWRCC
jgi:cell division protein FtsW